MHQQKYYDYWNHRRATVKDETYNIWGIITDGRLHKPRLAEIYFTGCRHTHTHTQIVYGARVGIVLNKMSQEKVWLNI